MRCIATSLGASCVVAEDALPMTDKIAEARARRAAEHTCHARGCDRRVPPRMLMCFSHWRMVPRDLQREVWATYQPGQERLDGTADVTIRYVDAAQAAVAVVAHKEGRR